MGGLFTKSKKQSRVTEQDKAVLVSTADDRQFPQSAKSLIPISATAIETTKRSPETISETHRVIFRS